MLKMTMRKVTKESKLALLAGKLAAKMARDNKDPLYRKYEKLRKAYFGVKGKIQAKYGNRAKMAAKKIANKS